MRETMCDLCPTKEWTRNEQWESVQCIVLWEGGWTQQDLYCATLYKESAAAIGTGASARPLAQTLLFLNKVHGRCPSEYNKQQDIPNGALINMGLLHSELGTQCDL